MLLYISVECNGSIFIFIFIFASCSSRRSFWMLDLQESVAGVLGPPLIWVGMEHLLLGVFYPVIILVPVLIATVKTWTLQMLLVDDVQHFQPWLLKECKFGRVGLVVTAQQALFTAGSGYQSLFLVRKSLLLFFGCPVKETWCKVSLVTWGFSDYKSVFLMKNWQNLLWLLLMFIQY